MTESDVAQTLMSRSISAAQLRAIFESLPLGLDIGRVQGMVERIKSTWKNAPELIAVESPQDASLSRAVRARAHPVRKS